jgi:hypothetical protein
MTLGTEAMELTPGSEGASVRAVTDGEQGLGGVGYFAQAADSRPTSQGTLEWFWRGKALAELRKTIPQPGDPAFAYATRAKECDALAHVAWTTSGLGGEAAACELYRQSAYWALRALNRGTAEPKVGAAYSEAVWAALEEQHVSSLPSVDREAVRARLVSGSFVHFAELTPAEQAVARLQLQGLATALLCRVALERRGYDRARRQRAFRLGVPLLLVCVALGLLLQNRAAHGDVANGAEWHASSAYTEAGGCASPQQTCPGNKGWFFHTLENDRDPWIELDLDGVFNISQVVIENRDDCCAERAVPMAIEISLGNGGFQQVAQRSKPFSEWRASFPSVPASRVRVHLQHKGTLHLKRVSIYR